MEEHKAVRPERPQRGYELIKALQDFRSQGIEILAAELFAPAGSKNYAYVELVGLEVKALNSALRKHLHQMAASWEEYRSLGFEGDKFVPFTLEQRS